MKINRLAASFGRLQGHVLTPGPGLNVIYAPNEGGKTTWCAFLRTMLYGIDTKERDTKTSLADKNRWQPWSGATMEGELVLTWRGRELVLHRFARGSVPFGGFSAADAATGRECSDLSAGDAGQTLVGVSRSVYERSAFIGQGAIPFTGERELEMRIAALVSSGEETVSYSKTEDRLKQWQRRRKFNKSGLIPKLEEELARLDGMLERIRSAHGRQENARLGLERLEAEQRLLKAEQEQHRRLAQRELDARCAQAQAALFKAQEEEAALRAKWTRVSQAEAQDTRFPGMTPEEAWNCASRDAAEAEELGSRSAPLGPQSMGSFAAALLACVLWIVTRLSGFPFSAAFALLAAVCAGAGVLFALQNRGRLRRQDAARAQLLARYGAAVPQDILNAAVGFREAVAHTEQEKRTVKTELDSAAERTRSARQLLDALLAGGGRPETRTQPEEQPRGSARETEARLTEVLSAMARLSGDSAMAEGEINTLGDPAALAARRDEITEELARRKGEYDALTLALQELSEANTELQARFSPALNARAGELMNALTGGKYDGVTLTRDFQATASETGGILPRRALTLSQGTADQLYLAVRLAVCELVLPMDEPPPLVLDDALMSFDRQRMELAMDLLREMGKTRQILLFTCHRREGEYLAHVPDVTHIDLQS